MQKYVKKNIGTRKDTRKWAKHHLDVYIFAFTRTFEFNRMRGEDGNRDLAQ